MQQKLPALTPQHISNICMALGKMEFPAPPFLAAVAAEAKPKLSQFNAQALSNTVCPAMGTLTLCTMQRAVPLCTACEQGEELEPIRSGRLGFRV